MTDLTMTNKRNDPKTAGKINQTTLDQILHKKQFPTIPPLPVVGKFVSNFGPKANFFNFYFFSLICTPIKNTSALPSPSYQTSN